MSAHASGVFGGGVEPPPDRGEPSRYVVMIEVSLSTSARSACVIWPILSASVMRPMRSATRSLTGRFGSWYGSPAALARGCVVAEAPGDSPTAIESASTTTLIDRIPLFLVMAALLPRSDDR